MPITKFCMPAAFCWMLVLLSSCRENPVETVENRNPEGQTERYQRRKKDFAKEGLYQRLSQQGRLLEEAHYSNDTLEGERKYFFPNGTVESVETYRHGQYHGPYRKYYENGQLYVEQEFADGAMQGISTVYYPNGKIREKVTIRNNEEDGPFQEYWENGNLHFEGTYVPDEEGSSEQGELKEYDESGQLIRIADCNRGVCLTKWKK